MFRKTKKCHSTCNSQSSDVCSKNKSVDSSLGDLSRSSTVASLDIDSSSSSGVEFLDVSAEFKVRYLGVMEGLPFSMCRTLLEPDDLISYIDAAQQDGRLPFVSTEDEVLLGVSKYGIRVVSPGTCDVVQRHPLRLVIQLVVYEDGLGSGRSLLALKTTDAGQEECSIWVYQCTSKEQAQAVCKVLSTAFNAALV